MGLNWEKVEIKCETCGEVFRGVRGLQRACDKCVLEERAQEERERVEKDRVTAESRYRQMVAAAGIPPKWTLTTFDGPTTNKAINKGAQRIAQEYAEKFTHQSGCLVFFSKKYGSGKTYLAVCIANHVLHELRRPVLFKKARDAMLEIRQTYSDRGESEAAVLNRLLGVELLVLDDVGIDHPTAWLEQTYWTVFDRRLEWQLPMVVTTNYPLEPAKGEVGLGERIGHGALSRLRSLCDNRVIHTAEKDLR